MKKLIKSLTKGEWAGIGLAALLLALIVTSKGPLQPKSNKQMFSATVKITNLAGNHGGTGSIIHSDKSGSMILTNRHVCKLAKKGAKVWSENKVSFVVSYKESTVHDLCVIEVADNLHVNLSIAEEPAAQGSQASVSGHPMLLPVSVTKGHFSGRLAVQVMTGLRPCTDKDLEDPANAFVCMLVGGMPVIESYDAQHITATIQGGNSGSAVYNEQGEIAGVVFAGRGDIGYGLIVPQEYVQRFLNRELSGLKSQQPDYSVELGNSSEEGKKMRRVREKLNKVCTMLESKRMKTPTFCQGEVYVGDDLIF